MLHILRRQQRYSQSKTDRSNTIESQNIISGFCIGELTLAIPITAVNIIGAIQGTCGGPRLVHAKPKRPIGRKGMTVFSTDIPLGIENMSIQQILRLQLP
jgi:hypothetical protein